MDAIPNHWYIVARCKTSKCGALQVLAYLGDHQTGPPSHNVSVPLGFGLWCSTCRIRHEYRLEDMSPRALPVSPLKGMTSMKNGTVTFSDEVIGVSEKESKN